MYKLQRKKMVPILFAQCVKKSNESATRNQLRNPNMTQFSVAFNTTVKRDAKMLCLQKPTVFAVAAFLCLAISLRDSTQLHTFKYSTPHSVFDIFNGV